MGALMAFPDCTAARRRRVAPGSISTGRAESSATTVCQWLFSGSPWGPRDLQAAGARGGDRVLRRRVDAREGHAAERQKFGARGNSMDEQWVMCGLCLVREWGVARPQLPDHTRA